MGVGLINSCELFSPKKDDVDGSQETQSAPQPSISTQVEIKSIEQKPFYNKLLVTGDIAPHRSILLKMDRGVLLTTFDLVDGQSITKGSLIAQLEHQELQHDLSLLKVEYDQAKLDRDERIMLLGGAFGQDSTISQEQLHYVEVKSGVHQISEQIKKNEYQLSKMSLYAPYSGIAADVQVRQHQVISPGEEICRLIDPTSYEARFQVLETSLASVRIGQKITFTTVAAPDRTCSAVIHKINPIIDENGLITIYALSLIHI